MIMIQSFLFIMVVGIISLLLMNIIAKRMKKTYEEKGSPYKNCGEMLETVIDITDLLKLSPVTTLVAISMLSVFGWFIILVLLGMWAEMEIDHRKWGGLNRK